MNKKTKQKSRSSEKDKEFPLPVYNKEDDIYSREKEEPLEDEDQTCKKESQVTLITLRTILICLVQN